MVVAPFGYGSVARAEYGGASLRSRMTAKSRQRQTQIPFWNDNQKSNDFQGA
jgi:hypothetical protein